MLSANLLYWTYAANYWSLSMRLNIIAEKDGQGARNFERTVFCVNSFIIVSNVVIVLIWQICYYNWCLDYVVDNSISTLYTVLWSIYIVMDLVSLVTLCYALRSIRRTLKLKEEKTMNTCMVTSLIIVYMMYIVHQLVLFIFLGVLQINDMQRRLRIVLSTQITFWLSEIILLVILTVLYRQQKLQTQEAKVIS